MLSIALSSPSAIALLASFSFIKSLSCLYLSCNSSAVCFIEFLSSSFLEYQYPIPIVTPVIRRPGRPPIAVQSVVASVLAPAVTMLIAAAPRILKEAHNPAKLALTDVVPALRPANHDAVDTAAARIFPGIAFIGPRMPLSAPLRVHALLTSPIPASVCLYISGVMLFVISIRSSSVFVNAFAAVSIFKSSAVICFFV